MPMSGLIKPKTVLIPISKIHLKFLTGACSSQVSFETAL